MCERERELKKKRVRGTKRREKAWLNQNAGMQGVIMLLRAVYCVSKGTKGD